MGCLLLIAHTQNIYAIHFFVYLSYNLSAPLAFHNEDKHFDKKSGAKKCYIYKNLLDWYLLGNEYIGLIYGCILLWNEFWIALSKKSLECLPAT